MMAPRTRLMGVTKSGSGVGGPRVPRPATYHNKLPFNGTFRVVLRTVLIIILIIIIEDPLPNVPGHIV